MKKFFHSKKAIIITAITAVFVIAVAVCGTLVIAFQSRNAPAPHIYLNGLTYWDLSVKVTSLPSGYTEAGTIKNRGNGNFEGDGVIPLGAKVYVPNDSEDFLLIKNIATYTEDNTVKSEDVYELYADDKYFAKELVFCDGLYVGTEDTGFDKKDFSCVGNVGEYSENAKSDVTIDTNFPESKGEKVFKNSDKTVLYIENRTDGCYYFKKV